jgi:hypothetical protein
VAVSDGKGAGDELINTTLNPKALVVAGAIAVPATLITLVLVIWAITST